MPDLLHQWGIRCTRYAPPPAARIWSPPAPCATSAGKPRTSAARAAAIHTPRKPIGSHVPVCWRGIRDASAQVTDPTDAAGTMACAAPPAPSPTIGRSNESSSSKPDWTPTTRHACAACASVATTARRQERNLQASTDEAFADSSLSTPRTHAVEPSRRRPTRAANVRRSGRQKRSSLFQFGSQPAAKPNARHWKTLENQRNQPAETPTGVPPNGLVARTAGELSPRRGEFKSFRGGGRKALRPTAKERRKAV